MPTQNVTSANVGTVLQTNIRVNGISMSVSPSAAGYFDYFGLSDSAVVGGSDLFNIRPAIQYISTGSPLLTGAKFFAQSLFLDNCPAGSTFVITYEVPPTLTTLAPATAVHATAPLTMTCTGTGFTTETVVTFGGVDLATTFVSATSVTCTVDPTNAVAGTVPVTVHNGPLVSTPAVNFTFT